MGAGRSGHSGEDGCVNPLRWQRGADSGMRGTEDIMVDPLARRGEAAKDFSESFVIHRDSGFSVAFILPCIPSPPLKGGEKP